MNVREAFNPVPMDADGEYRVTGMTMAGFLAKTSGTIKVSGFDSTGQNAVDFVDEVPVTAGIYTPIPCVFPVPGATVTLGGGASGTLFV